MSNKIVADTHIHSIISHDAHSELSMLCRSAIASGISVICLTDHVDCEHNEKDYFWPEIDFADDSVKAIKEFADEAGITVLNGIELGQLAHYPKIAQKVISLHDYDQIVLSQHTAYDDEDFYHIKSERIQREGDVLLRQYFEDLIKTAQSSLGDVIAHLNYPSRYYLRENEPCNLSMYYDMILDLFGIMIKKDIALECNTSGLRQPIGATLPDENILRMYYEKGGRLITLGSDAHIDTDVGKGIPEATLMLKEIGFKEAVYYKNRKPQPYAL